MPSDEAKLPVRRGACTSCVRSLSLTRRHLLGHGVHTGEGVVVVRGKLVENLHVEEALRVLAMAQAIEERRAQ